MNSYHDEADAMFSGKPYDMDEEIKKACAASAAGQKVVLFIGRGSKQGVLDQDHHVHYCYLSPLRDNFSLTSDKNSSELIATLLKLPKDKCKNLFDEVIIDGGTIDHLIFDFKNHLDLDDQVTASFIAAEISDGGLYDAKKIAASPAPIIYQFDSHSLIYYEYLLRVLAEMSRKNLTLVFPYGDAEPWKIGAIRSVASGQVDHASHLSMLTWYLMSRKECNFVIKDGGGKQNKFLPKNDLLDQHSHDNAGGFMFEGNVAYTVVNGLKPAPSQSASSTP
jgi:hypothetical protein